MNRHRPALTALCSAAFILIGTFALAAGRYDPRLRFHVIRTPHFTIYFHQGEAGMAARLAGIAENVRDDVARRTGLDAPQRVHVVLVDQSDVSNGWSTPVPYDLIEIAAIPPPPSSFLGYHDDWLRMVFAHEYTHILHLDRVGGVMKGLRWALGRSPVTFPNLFVPHWQVEGIATWAESAVTGLGRVHASDVAGVVSLASSGGHAAIDRAGGGLIAWPGGNAPYFLGGRFDEALAERYSAQALGDLSRETARRLPFLGGGAYQKVLGAAAGTLWRDVFNAPPAPAAAPVTSVVRLTHDGFAVTGPRLVRRRPGAAARAPTVFYSAQGPHRFPDIRSISPAGGTPSHVASRFDGQVVSSDGRWLYFDQLEFDGPIALVADLYALDLESGGVRRLSHGRRLTDPDVDASGTMLVAVQARDGEKRLTIWRLDRSADGVPALAATAPRTIGSGRCEYASPRWSPDARLIAAARQCHGSLPVIVVIAAADGDERVVASGGRSITPAWSPDGGSVVFASDREDGRFKLFAVAPDGSGAPDAGPALLLDAPGGVMWPDIDADGRSLVFASLTAEGYDVFAARLKPPTEGSARSWERQDRLPERGPAPPALREVSRSESADGPPSSDTYTPWKTLLPRAWSPLVTADGDDVNIGASAGASDVLGYHQYSASVMWRAGGRQSDFAFDGPVVGWSLSYAYNRWTPSFLLSAWNTFDTVAVSAPGSDRVLLAQERSQGLFAGVLLPWRRVRLAQSWLAGVDVDARRLPDSAMVPDRSRNGLRGGWALNSSHQYGYSISAEGGLWMALNAEQMLPGLGADGNALTLTGDWRGYVPGFGLNHVLAVRVGAASSTGDAGLKRSFSLGGSGLQADPFLLGQRVIGLLRGLPPDAHVGAALLVANLDYRLPLARVERGVGTWPFFLRDVHAAIFADVGSAGPTLDALPAAAWSAGAEVASRFTLGYSWNFNVAAGAAWVRDPDRPGEPGRFAAFVRTGYAF